MFFIVILLGFYLYYLYRTDNFNSLKSKLIIILILLFLFYFVLYFINGIFNILLIS
nr:MAG TPA: hypothetical protein [Microviridae sp.]